MNVSVPSVAPIGQPVKLKRELALGLTDVPTAEKLPKVMPVAVGTGVGSVVPVPELPETTLVKAYVLLNACPRPSIGSRSNNTVHSK